jgi:dimethylargininase
MKEAIEEHTDLAIVELSKTAPSWATVEGGDVLIAGKNVLIGVSKRTNVDGARALGKLLRSIDPELKVCRVPVPKEILHLKTGMTALNGKFVVHDPRIVIPQAFPMGTFALPPSEAYAGCVMPVKGSVFVPEGYRMAQFFAETFSLNGISTPLDLSEFAKMDGSLTCLSVRWDNSFANGHSNGSTAKA